MAATDMRLAGLEIGCKVNLPSGRHGTVVDLGPRRVRVVSLGTAANYDVSELVRDYDDAQAARHKRLDILDAHYPSDAQPENTDTIERYCGVVKTLNVETDQVGWWWYFSDTLEENEHDFGIFHAMAEVSDVPEAVFDLDTGERIELNVRMVIIKSDDQGACINVLEPDPIGTYDEQIRDVMDPFNESKEAR